MKVKIPNQNTGVISTPKAGGMAPFTSPRKGSVGHAMILHGTSFKFVSGYHEATTRHSCIKNDKKDCSVNNDYRKCQYHPNQIKYAPWQRTKSSRKAPVLTKVAEPMALCLPTRLPRRSRQWKEHSRSLRSKQCP